MTKDFTLEDIKLLINTAVVEAETRFITRMEEGINKIAVIFAKEISRLEHKIDDMGNDLRKEMRIGFEQRDQRVNNLEVNHNARLEILEEKVL